MYLFTEFYLDLARDIKFQVTSKGISYLSDFMIENLLIIIGFLLIFSHEENTSYSIKEIIFLLAKIAGIYIIMRHLL